MRIFKVNRKIEIVCDWHKSRIAFKHTATLLYNGTELETVKICYQNRTWESYEYESVLEKLVEENKTLSDREKKIVWKFIKNEGRVKEDCAGLNAVAMVAKLGEEFGSTQKEKNDWKERMLRVGLENKGLIMPEDWDSLDEDTKQARLDGAIGAIA